MKNLFFTVVALFATSSIFAQQGLEVTLGFTPGSSLFINDEDFAAGQELDFQATYAFHTGLTLGYNFNDKVGIATGVGYASLAQNYITGYDNVNKSDQDRWTRSQSYIRIPLLFRVGGDPTNGSSAFFRFGPHIDFLTNAQTIERGSVDNPRENTTSLAVAGSNTEIVNSTVFGITAEIGGRIRITDQMGVFIALHLESSLSNIDGKDATDNGRYEILGFTTNRYGFTVSGTVADPERSNTMAIMGGLTVGFQYVLSFD